MNKDLNMAKPSIIPEVKAHFGSSDVSQKDLIAFAKTLGRTWSTEFNSYKTGRGMYNFAMTATVSPIAKTSRTKSVSVPVPEVTAKVLTSEAEVTLDAGTQFEEKYLIPEVDPCFVPYGYFSVVNKILASNRFYPIYVTGKTGVGKSTSAIQAAAKLGKRIARVVITNETTDDDLFGRKTLKDGSIRFEDGIITLAAEMGFPVILDEISAGDPKKLFGLYTIMEGKRHYIKDANKFVNISPGFTIVATDNTLGKGDESGQYIGTNILNEAFLDRFAACYEQPYPPEKIEVNMLKLKFTRDGIDLNDENTKFISNIVKWANTIRKSYEEGAFDETISPRRLLFISENMAIFGSKTEAIRSIITRFDSITREAFLKLWDSIDAGDITIADPAEVENSLDEEIPF
jgi:hypothetical protein